VGVRLASLLDDRAILASLAEIAVPDVADWCVVIARLEGENTETVGVQHRDPAKQQALEELARRPATARWACC